MFFRKKDESHGTSVSAERPRTAVAAPSKSAGGSGAAATSDAQNAAILEAISGILAALARFPIDLPHRSAEATTKEMTAWQRHATLGMPVDDAAEATALGIADRDWRGLVRAVAALQRDQQNSVDGLVTELRSALWTCVSTVHEAVRIDDHSSSATDAQIASVKKAVGGLQHSKIRDDVLNAVGEIGRTLRERRDAQQQQYQLLATSLDTLGRQLEEAKKESATDPLTGVGNRKHFDVMSARAVHLFSLGRASVTLLMIDLNKLKVINDSYGHTAGDAAIVSVANALWKVFLRQSDVICRYGGDEFAVLLNGCDLVVAEKLANRLVATVRSLPAPSPQMEFALGASIGIAMLEAGEDVAQWVGRADKAMYLAKARAGSGVMVADRTPAHAALESAAGH
jgi:diguanylate cyclase